MKKIKLLLSFALIIFMASPCWSDDSAITNKTNKKIDEWSVWFLKGRQAQENRNYTEAIKFYKMVLEVKPDDALTRTNLANCYYDNKMFDEAIKEYKNSIVGGTPEDNYGLGYAYFAKENYDEGIAALNKFMAVEFNEAKALNDIKRATLNMGINVPIEDAKRGAKNAFIMDKASVHYTLGQLYHMNGSNAASADHFYKAGLIYSEAGDRENAAAAYESLKLTNVKELEKALFKKLYPEIK